MRTVPVYFYFFAFCGLVFVNTHIYRTIFAPKILTVAILETGKGNPVVLLRAPNKETLLINTGRDAGILRALGAALPEWKRNLDAILLTSDAPSARGGLRDIEDRYRVGEILEVGNQNIPYGSQLTFASSTRFTLVSRDTLIISYGNTSLTLSSTTPMGTYILDAH